MANLNIMSMRLWLIFLGQFSRNEKKLAVELKNIWIFAIDVRAIRFHGIPNVDFLVLE